MTVVRRAILVAVIAVGLPLAFGPAPAHATLREWTATVTSIVDGDTFFADVDGGPTGIQIRVAGLQTREFVGIDGKEECHAEEEKQHLASLIDGRRVVLKARSPSSSSLGRPIRHVFVGGANVAQLMLRDGMGVPLTFREEPDFAVENTNQSLLAAREGVGVWKDDRCGAGPSQSAELEMVTNYDAAHDDNTNINGEWIQLRNAGSISVDLDGWILRDEALRRFPLPSGYRLDPGDRLRIHVGSGTNTTKSIYLGSSIPILGNESDGVFLHDPDFDIRAFDMWPCTDTCTPPPRLTITKVNYDAPGDDRVNPNGEYVVITNRAGKTVDFQDWMIDLPRFQITSIASRPLAPGESLTLFMGTGVNTRTEMYLHESGGVLSNSNHIVTLYTPDRTVADCDARGTSVCPPVLKSAEPEGPSQAIRLMNAYGV